MTPQNREQILAALRTSGLSPRDRAELEAQLYASVPKAERGRSGIGVVLTVLFDLKESASEITLRQRLRSAGPAAIPLWDAMVQKGMPLRTAVKILVDGMRRAHEYGTFPESEIALMISQWEERSVVVRGPNGNLMRKQSPTARKSNPDEALREIRERAVVYACAFGKAIPAMELAPILSEFTAEVDALVTGFALRIKREQKRAENGTREERITRRAFFEALDALGMSRVRYGADINLDDAKKRMRALAHRYHPDKTGNHESRDLFEAVVAAYKTLETYCEETSHGAQGREERVEG